jgi:hypothetical protein
MSPGRRLLSALLPLLAGCADTSPPHLLDHPPAPIAFPLPGGPLTAPGGGLPSLLSSNPAAVPPQFRIPPYLPVAGPLPPTPTPQVIAPAATATPGQFAPPPNAGPVTGYGIGGLQQPPGAPPNPSYPRGGLLHP